MYPRVAILKTADAQRMTVLACAPLVKVIFEEDQKISVSPSQSSSIMLPNSVDAAVWACYHAWHLQQLCLNDAV